MNLSLAASKVSCYALAILLVLAGETVVAHNNDYEEDHHAHHDCQSYQSFNGDIIDTFSQYCFVLSSFTKHRFQQTASIYPVFSVTRVRGPPLLALTYIKVSVDQ